MNTVLTAIAAPFLILLFILSIPIMLPFVAIAEKRTAKRKQALVAIWPCGWCVAPLGPEALVRADALFAAYANEAFAEFAPSKTFAKFDASGSHHPEPARLLSAMRRRPSIRQAFKPLRRRRRCHDGRHRPARALRRRARW